MNQIKTIEINYQSLYNGCDLYCAEVDDVLEDDKAEGCVDAIVSYAHKDCDDDGLYVGDIDLLAEFAIKTVREAYGDDVKVTFVDDSTSS